MPETLSSPEIGPSANLLAEIAEGTRIHMESKMTEGRLDFEMRDDVPHFGKLKAKDGLFQVIVPEIVNDRLKKEVSLITEIDYSP